MQRQRIGKVVEQRIERAGKRRKEAGDREREPDVAFDRECQEARAALVLADRAQGMAEGRADRRPIKADGDREDDQEEIVEIVGRPR